MNYNQRKVDGGYGWKNWHESYMKLELQEMKPRRINVLVNEVRIIGE